MPSVAPTVRPLLTGQGVFPRPLSQRFDGLRVLGGHRHRMTLFIGVDGKVMKIERTVIHSLLSLGASKGEVTLHVFFCRR